MSDSNRENAFTDFEEEFFRAGAALELGQAETFADLDEGYEQPSLWRRLFGRRQVPQH